jgi:hypothetical protein
MSYSDIAHMFYKRDLEMKLDPLDTIINHLKKLRYYNINLLFEESTFSGNKDSEEYKKFKKNLNYRIERSIILSKYINKINIKEFYNSCTTEELYYLGY